MDEGDLASVDVRSLCGRAVQNGFDTLFVTAAELIEDFSVALREGRSADALTRHITSHVLVCDESAT